MQFISISVLVGIPIGFGGIDTPSLVNNFDRRATARFLIKFLGILLIILLTLLALNLSSFVLLVISILIIGLMQWVYGFIRSYHPVRYEFIVLSSATIVWLLLLFLVKAGADSKISYVFLNLVSLSFAYGYLIHVISKLRDRKSKGPLKNINFIGIFHHSMNKLSWDILYTGVTRFPFLGLFPIFSTYTLLPYLYLFCEFLYSGFSHVSTFLLGRYKYHENKKNNLIVFTLLLFLIVYLILILFLFSLKYDVISESLFIGPLKKFLNFNDDIYVLIIFILNMLFLQSSYILRYKKIKFNKPNWMNLNIFPFFALISIYTLNYFAPFLNNFTSLSINAIFSFFIFIRILKLSKVKLWYV